MLHTLLLAPLSWTVPANTGYDFYTLCYVLAFGLNIALLIWEGHRRGFPMRPWLVLLACTTLAFILGTKLLAFSGPEWQHLVQTGQWSASGARTVLGGALAGTLTLLALRRPFGFSWHVFDAFTVPMCAAMVVQCVGCTLTGCCFGEPTAGGWGLTYPPGTLPYFFQVYQGLLPTGASQSLPVHPTQLYSLVLCAGVGGVLLLLRHRAWPGGSRRLLHLGLLLTGRFLIEFWRDPAGEQIGAAMHTHGGIALKQVQWALLLLAPVALGWWLWLVRRARRVPAQPVLLPTQNSVRNLLAVAGLLGITASLGPQALTLPEVLVVKALLLAVLLLEGGALLLGAAEAARPARIALPLGLASLMLVLTSQMPADSARSAAYLSFTPGYVAGRYDEDVTYAPSAGCSGSTPQPVRAGYYHRYQAAGGEVAYTRPSLRRPGRTTYGLGLWGGSEYVNIRELTPGGPFLTADAKDGSHYTLFDVNPYLERDRSEPGSLGYGLRLGLHMGQLAYVAPKSASSELRTVPVVPDVKLWLGVRRSLFGQADYGTGPLGMGNATGRLALGSGLGSDWNRYVLAGLALAHHAPGSTMGFLSASFPLGSTGLWLEPYGATNFSRHRQLSVRLQYRLGSGR